MTTDGVLHASDKMDDGSVINPRVEIDSQERSATFDFEGISPMVINNLNAPRAITKSAIIYCLRCMVGYDIPLNQGCLAPIHLPIHTIGSYSTPISRYAVVLKNFQLLPGIDY
ncbi:unnamed protein product [Clavelina lepadiformis]|uniref:Hydantoinase B/oxoprolinase domain-containing protein n=1 Tax=Clavelina lepadiformis TaxID=159417 RepID=A0ABP0G984_CLALP